MNKLEYLFDLSLVWKKSESNSLLYICFIEDQKYLLRLNDFPSEPMFTLLFEDLSVDFDDLPDNWEILY